MMNQDEEHLRMLTIFHYVVAGLAGLFALFPLLHLIVGIIIVENADTLKDSDGPSPAVFGWFFIVFASFIMAMGWTFAACVFAAGRRLAQRKSYMFCLVMGGVECIFMPFGTALGVFTILVLMRPSVKAMFGVAPPGQPYAPVPASYYPPGPQP